MSRLAATSRLINKFTANGYSLTAAEAASDSFQEAALVGIGKLVDQLNGTLAVSSVLFGTLLVGGDISAAITQTTKSQIGNMADTAPYNPSTTNGSLLLYARNVAGAEVVVVTQDTVRGRWGSTGLTLAAAGNLKWQGQGGISSPSDGVLLLTDTAGTAFSRVQFGGTTASYPALRRATTRLMARLADDSAYTNIEMAMGINSAGLVVSGAFTDGHSGDKGVFDFSGGVVRIVTYGTNGSTNGTWQLVSRRSDGTNGINVLTTDATGNVTVGVNLILAAAAVAGTGSNIMLGGTTQTTVGANGAASALTANPLGYLIAFKGVTKIAIPYYNG